MSRHGEYPDDATLPDDWYDPQDVAELVKFQSFLRRAAEEPRGSRRTWGELYDEVYGNGDREEDAEAGIPRPLRSDGSRFYDDWEVPCEEG